MKKLLLSILLFSILPLTLACTNHSTPSGENTLSGTVTAVNSNNIIIKSEGIDYQINFDTAVTQITKNGSPLAPNQIQIGSQATVTHNGQMTRSLPPQVFALSILIT